jgi:periplasmic protein TonB
MTFPPPPPPTTPPRKSNLVPLLIVGTIAVITLMAGAAAAIMIMMMNSGAFSPAPKMRDTPPVAQTPPPDAPAEPEPAAVEPERPTAGRPARERSPRTGEALGSHLGGLPEAPAPPPPPMPIRAGGRIKAPVKLRNVNPVYPQIAQSARVQGAVIIEATIDPRGKISDTRVVRSIPLLDQAAVDAVRQWEYEPTMLNGVPVPVIMTVTVNFSLQR